MKYDLNVELAAHGFPGLPEQFKEFASKFIGFEQLESVEKETMFFRNNAYTCGLTSDKDFCNLIVSYDNKCVSASFDADGKGVTTIFSGDLFLVDGNLETGKWHITYYDKEANDAMERNNVYSFKDIGIAPDCEFDVEGLTLTQAYDLCSVEKLKEAGYLEEIKSL